MWHAVLSFWCYLDGCSWTAWCDLFDQAVTVTAKEHCSFVCLFVNLKNPGQTMHCKK